ncbi:MAG: phage head morphogenesis protein, partial [Thermoplasmata archaeon]
MNVGKAIRRARLIARTEIIKSYNTAIATKYKSSGVKKFRWLAAIDQRTCP